MEYVAMSSFSRAARWEAEDSNSKEEVKEEKRAWLGSRHDYDGYREKGMDLSRINQVWERKKSRTREIL